MFKLIDLSREDLFKVRSEVYPGGVEDKPPLDPSGIDQEDLKHDPFVIEYFRKSLRASLEVDQHDIHSVVFCIKGIPGHQVGVASVLNNMYDHIGFSFGYDCDIATLNIRGVAIKTLGLLDFSSDDHHDREEVIIDLNKYLDSHLDFEVDKSIQGILALRSLDKPR